MRRSSGRAFTLSAHSFHSFHAIFTAFVLTTHKINANIINILLCICIPREWGPLPSCACLNLGNLCARFRLHVYRVLNEIHTFAFYIYAAQVVRPCRAAPNADCQILCPPLQMKLMKKNVPEKLLSYRCSIVWAKRRKPMLCIDWILYLYLYLLSKRFHFVSILFSSKTKTGTTVRAFGMHCSARSKLDLHCFAISISRQLSMKSRIKHADCANLSQCNRHSSGAPQIFILALTFLFISLCLVPRNANWK